MTDYGKSLFTFGTALAFAEKDRLEQANRQARVVAVGRIEAGKRSQDVENTFAERVEEYELG
jgi:hypothetical protein